MMKVLATIGKVVYRIISNKWVQIGVMDAWLAVLVYSWVTGKPLFRW